jgi:vacuolar protein sorting-associated protein 13A/C
LHQRVFELSFEVEELRASLSKSKNGIEKPIGDVSFGGFSLVFGLAKFDMRVEVNLR